MGYTCFVLLNSRDKAVIDDLNIHGYTIQAIGRGFAYCLLLAVFYYKCRANFRVHGTSYLINLTNNGLDYNLGEFLQIHLVTLA
jgi:hypothetical protein